MSKTGPSVSPEQKQSHVQATDLHGAERPAVDAATGLTDLVEAVHDRIARLPGQPAPALTHRTQGIAGLGYKTVRARSCSPIAHARQRSAVPWHAAPRRTAGTRRA